MGLFRKKPWYPSYEVFASCTSAKATGGDLLVADHKKTEFSVLPVGGRPSNRFMSCMVIISIGPDAQEWAKKNGVIKGKTAVIFKRDDSVLIGPFDDWTVWKITPADVVSITEWHYYEEIEWPNYAKKRYKDNGRTFVPFHK